MGEKKEANPGFGFGFLEEKEEKKGNWAMKQIKVDLAPLPLIPFTYYEVKKGKKSSSLNAILIRGKKYNLNRSRYCYR